MNVRHLTFRLLQVYVAVVRLGSVSRAAAQLHLTQPTVSQQLKRLAEAVGEPLLDTHMKPTFIGTELYHAALDALSRFEDFGGFLQDARQGTRGGFSIGVVTTAKYILPRLLGPFNRQFPGVEVSISVGNRGYILERHRHQQDDLYLFSHPPAGEHTLSALYSQPAGAADPAGSLGAATAANRLCGAAERTLSVAGAGQCHPAGV
ncbi:LysR family transcriptional regulator [Oceanimonas sp. NS1]|nr:LysR family transcriptional regulator [Oceanimonas sp. NS1]